MMTIIIIMMMMMMMMIVVSRGRLTPVELVVRWWEVKPEEAHMLTMFGRDHSVIITATVMMIGMNMMINDQIIMVMQVLWMLTIV